MRRQSAYTSGLITFLALAALIVACSDAERTSSDGGPREEAKQAGSTPTQPTPGGTPTALPASALEQLRALRDDKLSRTPAQRKIDSNLLFEGKRRRGERLFERVPELRWNVSVSASGTTLVDIRARVSERLLARIESLGGVIESSVPRFDAIRAELPVDALEPLAADPDVRRIRRAAEYMTNKDNTSQGDVAHRAAAARSLRGIDGTGVVVGVISDGAQSFAARQASGDLPAGGAVEILLGQGGSGDEGTAMMEIIFDLAPGAQLKFATGLGGPAVMAQNILNLRGAGANVIVDDLYYFGEGVFQDDVIAQAVQFVTNAGALYFSSAGNSGNLNDGQSGVYEGNYAPTTMLPGSLGLYDDAHNFGGSISDLITVDPPRFISLQWSDPLNGSGNDYDLYVFNGPMTAILGASIDNQNGSGDPFEDIESLGNDAGRRIVVARWSGDTARFLHVNTHRGRLGTATFGQISGHAAAPNAFAVAAVNVATAGGGAFVGGATNPIETFSSDGPRRVFYEENGTAISPGVFVAPGGDVRDKPDIAAADGVATAAPGFNPFFGTSAAAPHAAAIAALVLQARPNVKTMGNANATAFVRALLQSTSLDIEAAGIDRDSGSGIVMADSATAPCAGPSDGMPCNDGNGCTQTDTCQGGVCIGSNPLVCSPSDTCHDAGTCEPANGQCSNPVKSDGSSCSDGNACTQTDSCVAGTCTGTSPVVCPTPDQCHDPGTCSPATGQCSNPPKPNGSVCSDGNGCTQSDSCQSGSCTGGTAVVCTASDQCHDAGTCDPANGQCSNPPKPNGSVCSDGNGCTQSDSCQSGSCTGGTAVVCTASDQCHDAGTCDPANGQCSNPAKPNGSPCSDSNACTQADSCQAGACTGASPVVCPTPDQCHDPGVCNPSNGQCSNPEKPNGSICSDGNVCTQSDTCQAGACAGGNPVVCTASDQCHDAGTCDPANGQCSNPAKPNGSVCSDSNACTQSDSCQSGTCTGTDPVVCTASDQCHDIGTCNPADGQCSNPSKPNGSPCSDSNACTQSDSCQSGACTGASPVVCPTPDQCHDPGVCNPSNGQCSNPAKPNGSPCSDDDACTQSDSCQSGACAGSSPVVCTASDQCHVAGTCDPASGQCSNPAKPNGSPCSDSNACTQSDSCQSGACAGASPVVCPTPDQCHDPGICNPSNGQCSNPAKPNGSICSDNNACTDGDSCQTGSCASGSQRDCSDGNVCTDDACSPASGCTYANNSDACSDGNACTGNDTCSGGACVSGGAVNCNDTNACTDDSCVPASGCLNAPNTGSCSDGDECNGNETCNGAGTCTPGPVTPIDDGNPCTIDACTLTGGITHTPVAAGTPCPDADLCDGTEVCNASAACVAGTPLDIDDGNACTADGCVPATGATHTPVAAGTACLDATVCNGAEACSANGVCSPGVPLAVDDQNPCTTDACDPVTGVSHTLRAAGSPCADANGCNGDETCNATGQCMPGTAVVCAPLDACHVAGTCAPATGTCSNPAAPDGTACPGGSCDAGRCEPDGSGGAGGTTGTGGSPDTGGSGGANAGEGGTSTGGSAGTSGSGGSATGGATGEAGEGSGGEDAPGKKSGSSQSSGCGCAVPGRSGSSGAPLVAAFAAALLVMRRRRSGSQRARPAA